MKKRMISAFLLVCMLFSITETVVLAADQPDKRDYYNLNVIHTDYQGKSTFKSVDFMVLTPGEDSPRVYIKAEDFSKLTGGDYSYEYNQTYTECAYVSATTKHVVRYMLNSSNVSVVYVGDSITYTSPYDTLYENGVTWLPFEFSVQIFHLQAVPMEETIQVISSRYNPLSIANLVHEQIREAGFSWFDEVGESLGEYMLQMASATTASCINKLLSFEPSEWGAMLLSAFGNSYFIDIGYAETISKSFISPSQQEINIADSQYLQILSKTPDAFDDMMEVKDFASSLSKSANNTEGLITTVLEKVHALKKSKAVTNLQKAITENKNGFKKTADEILSGMKTSFDDYGASSAKIIEHFLTFVELMENYMIFLNKNDRAVSALKLYSDESKYDEKDVFAEYAVTDNAFLLAVKETAEDAANDGVNDGILGSMGLCGALLSGAGFAWNFASGMGPLKTGLDATDSRVLSEYAIMYQDDALGMYYNYRNACVAAGGANEESLDDMLNALYAYLKFSYIARNAASASFAGKAQMTWGDCKVNAENCYKALEKNNQALAEYLIYMEGDLFTPSDAGSFSWDDQPYSNVISGNGEPIEAPTQKTEPIFEFPQFPGSEDDSYITEEEAIELAQEVMDKYSGGMINSELFGEYLADLYTYEIVDHYADDDIQAYVVQVAVDGNPSALFFVSVIGTEVWLGAPESGGGYYVYTDLDLLHANVGDLLGALNDLGGQMMEEAG